MAGMQYQEKTAQENLQHPVMDAVFFVAIKNEAGFFVCGRIRHIAVVNINFVYEERGIKYAVCNFKR